ncbi:MAG: hypothetical protein V1929_01370 [bacterium]
MEAATAAAAAPPPPAPPIRMRKQMRLRDTMLDEPAPTTVTSVMWEQKPANKSWFARETRKEDLTEAAASYQFADERKSSTAKMLVLSAACSLAILAVQYMLSGNSVIQARIAQGYLYAFPIFSLALLLTALTASLQRLVVLIILPACWITISSSVAPSRYMDYFMVFTVVAYFIYIVEFVLRGMESPVFRVFCLTYLSTFLTQLYFVGGNKNAMASLSQFPLLKKVMDPTLQTLNLLHAMIN